MKSKRQNQPYNLCIKRNNNTIGHGGSPLQQLQNLHRSIDRLPSNQQNKSVVVLKRKKHSPMERHTNESKNKRITQNAKKNPNQSKRLLDDVCTSPFKRKQHLATTKTTMPSSTLGNFKKFAVVQTFELKIDLKKSGIKKINSLCNSSSSRYLTAKYQSKQQKNKDNKITMKSPNKYLSPSSFKIKSPHKQPLTESNSTQRLKTGKHKEKDKEKDREKDREKSKKIKAKQQNIQYIFIDGKYFQVQNPVTQLLTRSMIILSRQSKQKNNHQSVQGKDQGKPNLQHSSKHHHLTEQSQSDQQASIEHQNCQFVKNVNSNFILTNIIFIQRWWKNYLKSKKLQKYNHKVYNTPKAQPSSEQSLQEGTPSPEKPKQPNTIAYSSSQKDEQISFKSFIEVKQQLIEKQMQSQKQLLTKMFELNKIDHLTLTSSLAKVESNFQKEILEIDKLREQIQTETIRTKQLQQRLKLKHDIICDIENIPTNVILDNFFPKSSNTLPIDNDQDKNSSKFQRQKSTGCHYSSLSQPKNSQPGKQQMQISSPVNLHLKQFEEEADPQEDQYAYVSQTSSNGQGEFINYLMFYDQETAQTEIEKRYAMQLGMGCLYGKHKPGTILTSVISIHNFMMSFLKFYQYFYKEEFLKLINLPYGLSQFSRLKKLQGNYQKEKKKSAGSEDSEVFFQIEFIIGSQILQAFQQHTLQLPQTIDDLTKTAVYFQKIHQRAIIDCFNQSINCFRPYYFINGAPYSWNYSQKALTFYYIAEQNIHEVFEKTQYKVLKNASCMCGTIVQSLINLANIGKQMNLEIILQKYRESVNQVLAEGRDEKLIKVEKIQVEETNFIWDNFQEDKTYTMLTVANIIFQELILEVIHYKPIGHLLEEFFEATCYNDEKTMPQTEKSTPQRQCSEKTIQQHQLHILLKEQQFQEQTKTEKQFSQQIGDKQQQQIIPHSEQETAKQSLSSSGFQYE